MRILIGSNVHWWNAEAAYAAKIAQLLQKAGHKVFVLTCPDSLNSQKLGSLGLYLVEHINLNSNNPFQLLLSFQKLKNFIDEEQIDLVNPHRSEGFPLFVFATRAVNWAGIGLGTPLTSTLAWAHGLHLHLSRSASHISVLECLAVAQAVASPF